MSVTKARQIVLAARPQGKPRLTDFRVEETAIPTPGADVITSGLWPRSDREPCPLETSVPGVLAAGDIRAGSVKRVGFAVGDGSLAVACAHRLVSINR